MLVDQDDGARTTSGVGHLGTGVRGNRAAGGNGASGSASGPVLTNDANKVGASILTLIVVVAAAIGL